MALDVMTTSKFSRMIEKKSVELDITVFEAVIDYCDKNEVEIEMIAKLCNSKIKKAIFSEALVLNMVKEPEVVEVIEPIQQ